MTYSYRFGAASFIAGLLAITAARAAETCNPLTEITRTFTGDPAAVYRLNETDSTKVVEFYTEQVYGVPPPSPVQYVWIGLNGADHSAGFLFLGPDGCLVANDGGWTAEDVQGLLDALGTAEPQENGFILIPAGKVDKPGIRA